MGPFSWLRQRLPTNFEVDGDSLPVGGEVLPPAEGAFASKSSFHRRLRAVDHGQSRF